MAEPMPATDLASSTRRDEKLAISENNGAGLDFADDQTLQPSTQHSNASIHGDTELEGGHIDKANQPTLSTIDEKQQDPVDPNVVDWNGPDDPEKPTNWPASRKYGIVAIISTITFLTYVLLIGLRCRCCSLIDTGPSLPPCSLLVYLKS